jgi:hypothetical protein
MKSVGTLGRLRRVIVCARRRRGTMEHFQPYLEAAGKSGDRARAFIYIMILVNFCILAAILNSIAPDWNDLRLDRLKIVLSCSDSAIKD